MLRFRDKHSNHCSEEVKQFTMALQYSSLNVYQFVCKVLLLPHPTIISTLASSVDCELSFFYDAIKLIGDIAEVKPYMLDIILMNDTIIIHKGTCWDQLRHRYSCFVVVVVIGSTQLHTSY